MGECRASPSITNRAVSRATGAVMRACLVAFAMLVATTMLPGAAVADKRVALVIGNSAYRQAPVLANPANDASDFAATLTRLGFDVVRGVDLDFTGMRERIRLFGDKLDGADVALFFYAGHGLQVDGKNYLAPVDVNLRSRADLDLGTIDMDLVLRVMEAAKRTNIVLLDACRDNPLIDNLAAKMGTRGLATGRGLAQVNSGVGTLIAYATQPGNVALDGRGRNSPFTAALLRTVEKPGLSLTDLMVEVRNEVLRDTDGKQVPWDHSSLTGPFYFTAPPPPPAAADGASPAAIDLAFWDSIKDSNNARLFEAYLKRYPGGAFADIARIRLEATASAAAKPLTEAPSDNAAVSGARLAELKDRLYELNFDPDTAGERSLKGSIREFETQNNLPATGEPSDGLLRRLRAIGGLKPWGAIVYDKGAGAWGMSWGGASRRAAVAEARVKCKGAACPVELSFYGTGCAAFAQTGGSWAIVGRDSLERSRQAALDDCGRRGKRCQIVGAVCADGAGRHAE